MDNQLKNEAQEFDQSRRKFLETAGKAAAVAPAAALLLSNNTSAQTASNLDLPADGILCEKYGAAINEAATGDPLQGPCGPR